MSDWRDRAERQGSDTGPSVFGEGVSEMNSEPELLVPPIPGLPSDGQAQSMTFLGLVGHVFSHYNVLTGRASRAEYWCFRLFEFVTLNVLDYISTLMGNSSPFVLGVIVTFVPHVSLTVRRLHDVNRSGWWWFVPFTIIGIIPAFYWTVKRGDTGPNRFGMSPLASLDWKNSSRDQRRSY